MSPRDGLQFIAAGVGAAAHHVPLEARLQLVRRLIAANLPFIEVGAFVSPKVTPQMADTDALCAALAADPGPPHIVLAALVPNLNHYQRFRATRLHCVSLFVSASEAYALANTRASAEDLMRAAADVAAAARHDGRTLRAHLSAAFQDIADGRRPSDLPRVIDLAQRLVQMGCECVALADTNGDSNPRRVREVVRAVADAVGLPRVAVHLHDRNGAGLANALAAFDAGVRIFDASVGGIGGSAVAGALKGENAGWAGNVATEELVDMFERMGVSTGVDPHALLDAGRIVDQITRTATGSPPPSRLLQAQLRS